MAQDGAGHAVVARHLLRLVQPAPPAARPAADSWVETLSPLELEVLRRVADGCSCAEIGRQLFVSVNTGGTHIKHIYDTLAVNSRGKAVREAGLRGLLGPAVPGPRS